MQCTCSGFFELSKVDIVAIRKRVLGHLVIIDESLGSQVAEELGMATIHHVDSEQTVAALEQLLGVELR